jgi:Fe2+ or Zn2+ uptake regulation protein
MLNRYTAQLRERGFRITPQRLAILNILCNTHCHLSPLEIYQQTQADIPGLTEATVYRTLTFLVEQGLAMPAHIGSGQLVYEIAERAHDHLICRACGLNREINHEDLRELYEQFQAKTGFKIDSMHVTFFGLCPNCQSAE